MPPEVAHHRLKLHYLLHGMGGSPVVPFGSLVGRQLGVSPASIGLTFLLMPLAGLVIKPLLGGLADKYGAKKRVLMLVILSAMVFYSILPLLPNLPTSSTSLLSCSPTSSTLQLRTTDPCLTSRLVSMFNHSTVECTASCTSTPLSMKLQPGLAAATDGALLLPVISPCPSPHLSCTSITCPSSPQLAHLLNSQGEDHEDQLGTYQLWLFILVLILASVSFGCGCTFQESICHEVGHLRWHLLQVLGGEAEEKYGQQRLFASLGWGAMAALAGWLVELDSRSAGPGGGGDGGLDGDEGSSNTSGSPSSTTTPRPSSSWQCAGASTSWWWPASRCPRPGGCPPTPGPR